MYTPDQLGTPPDWCPQDRDPAQVAPAHSYRRDDPVWVYRDGSWKPGVVNGASPLAVMVTYQSTTGRGTVVDTVTAEYLVHPGAGRPGGDR
ncbi:MAG TPA: hypothetical protein VIL37_17830 [Natronosporangium sp.]